MSFHRFISKFIPSNNLWASAVHWLNQITHIPVIHIEAHKDTLLVKSRKVKFANGRFQRFLQQFDSHCSMQIFKLAEGMRSLWPAFIFRNGSSATQIILNENYPCLAHSRLKIFIYCAQVDDTSLNIPSIIHSNSIEQRCQTQKVPRPAKGILSVSTGHIKKL